MNASNTMNQPPQPPPDAPQDADAPARGDFLADIPGFAAQHVEMVQSVLGETLDYSATSLEAIDSLIATHWPTPPVKMNLMVVLFGSYVGETIRRALGGIWTHDDDGGYCLADVGGCGIRIFPFSKVHKRFVSGPVDSVAFYFAALSRIVAVERAKQSARPQAH